MKSLFSLIRDGLEEMQARLLSRKLIRDQQQAYETTEPEPFPLPLELGCTINELRDRIREMFGDDEAMDELDLSRGTDRAARKRSYVMEGRGSTGVNVVYRYWENDGRVWSISVANASPYYEADLGKLSLSATVETIRLLLGEPISRSQCAPVMERLLWETPEYGYRVDAYSITYSDIAGYARPGDISEIEWYARSLAPSGYDGGTAVSSPGD